MINEITIKTLSRNEMIDITGEIAPLVSGIREGVMTAYVPHTTAGLTINEKADPNVLLDIQKKLGELVPKDKGYKHKEGNSDAHIKSSIIGNTVQIIIRDGVLQLGRWQSILLCEFDGPRKRKVIVQA